MNAPETESNMVDVQYEAENIGDEGKSAGLNEIELYEKRAGFRNKHRKPLIETTTLFRRFIPEVSVDEIKMEETERLFFEVRKSIREGLYETIPDAFEAAKTNRNQMVDYRGFYVDEYGKYYAGRMKSAWLKADYGMVLDLYNEFQDNTMYEDDYREAVERETGFMLADQVVKFIRNNNCLSAIEGILKLYEIKKITLCDLLNAGIRENERVMLEKAIKDFLVGWFIENPLIYSSLLDVFENLGFRFVNEIKEYSILKDAVNAKLEEAAKAGIVYLEEAIYVFNKLNLLDAREVMEKPVVRAEVVGLLAEAAGISPEAYVRVRDFVVEKGIIDSDDADQSVEVSEAASEFLSRMYKVHPELALLCFSKYVTREVNVTINDEVLDLLRNYARNNVVLSRLGVNIMDMDYFIRAQAKTNVDNSNDFLQNHTERELEAFEQFSAIYQKALEEFMDEFPALNDFMVSMEDL